jgi:hypothetical protein
MGREYFALWYLQSSIFPLGICGYVCLVYLMLYMMSRKLTTACVVSGYDCHAARGD